MSPALVISRLGTLVQEAHAWVLNISPVSLDTELTVCKKFSHTEIHVHVFEKVFQKEPNSFSY